MGMAHKLHAYATAVGLSLTDDSVLLQFGAGVTRRCRIYFRHISADRCSSASTTIVTALFMLIFTAITVWIYIDNPVADCGCFGDAITLTNGQTLVKNIVLLSAAVYLSCYPQKIRRFISARNNWVISIYSWIYAIALSLYTLHYLPIIDFSPYTKGANIKAAFETNDPDGASNKLVNFYLADQKTGDDVTFDILQHNGYTFLLTVPSTVTADDGCCDRIKRPTRLLPRQQHTILYGHLVNRQGFDRMD